MRTVTRTVLALALSAIVVALPSVGVADEPAAPPQPPAPPEPAAALTVNVQSFNIRYDNPGDGPNRWAQRIGLAAEVIASREPDFVGVQEAMPHQIADLRKKLPGYAHVGRSREVDPQRGEATPIFYRTDRWEPVEHETFWLSDTPGEPGSKGWGNDIPRIATLATFTHKPTGRRVAVFNTHFDHRSQPSREKSAALLAERIKQIDGPLVVTGDFNAGEDNPAIATLRAAGLVDTFRIVHPEGTPVGTFNGFAGRADGAKIDFVFVPAGVKTTAASIIRDHTDGRYPSDHFPVDATVVFE